MMGVRLQFPAVHRPDILGCVLRCGCVTFQVWSNNYPEQVRGVPGSRFTSPETLQAFNEHCAAVSAAAKSALYMRGKGLV